MLHNVEALLIPKGQKHRNLIGRQSRGWITSTSSPNVVQKFLLKDKHEKSDLGETIWQKPKSHRGRFLLKLQMGSETWSDWWWLPAARGRKEGEERERWDSDRSGSCLLMEGPTGWKRGLTRHSGDEDDHSLQHLLKDQTVQTPKLSITEEAQWWVVPAQSIDGWWWLKGGGPQLEEAP